MDTGLRTWLRQRRWVGHSSGHRRQAVFRGRAIVLPSRLTHIYQGFAAHGADRAMWGDGERLVAREAVSDLVVRALLDAGHERASERTRGPRGRLVIVAKVAPEAGREALRGGFGWEIRHPLTQV